MLHTPAQCFFNYVIANNVRIPTYHNVFGRLLFEFINTKVAILKLLRGAECSYVSNISVEVEDVVEV
ncbi:hypothetical protein PRIPAC_83077 [Pristionchus pacificus]|nr:hypothetical protein PRIPAC_83077 [Pristionchus pacificus]